MSGDYHEEQKGRIERDLASFADPGSVATTGNGRRFTAELHCHSAEGVAP